MHIVLLSMVEIILLPGNCTDNLCTFRARLACFEIFA
jgi:hypothetical protein